MMLARHEGVAGRFVVFLVFQVRQFVLRGGAGGTDAADQPAFLGMRMSKAHKSTIVKITDQPTQSCGKTTAFRPLGAARPKSGLADCRRAAADDDERLPQKQAAVVKPLRSKI
jgi:hypothetical protein